MAYVWEPLEEGEILDDEDCNTVKSDGEDSDIEEWTATALTRF